MAGSPSITTLLSEDGYSHFVVVVGWLVGWLSWWAWFVLRSIKTRQHRSQLLLGKRNNKKNDEQSSNRYPW